MNRAFRTLWSHARQCWVVVSELARSSGKKGVKSIVSAALAEIVLGTTLAGSVAAQPPPEANQLPTGGSVVRGTATISQTATAEAAAMMINQTSQRAVVNWDSFNLGSAASITFVQPNAQSVTLNRVNDGNPSQIFGRITSNGQVFLTNGNGVYFSPSSTIDVGAFAATTHAISNDNFMAGKYVFERNGAVGKIVNEGRISTSLGGYVALLAPEVQNAGVVVARAGTVAMAAGEQITLKIDSVGSLAGLTTTPSTIATLIENRLAVQAPDGQIILSNSALNTLRAGVIRNSGSLEANSIVSKGGRIYLEGDEITLAANSKIEAKGPTGGGSVLVGGDWQGSGSLRHATRVVMASGATIDASATDSGDGGKVVLWSDTGNPVGSTVASGAIYARGGPRSGNGGSIETSGHHLDIDASTGDASAPQGKAGEWLMDPYNVTITTATANGAFSSSGSTDTWAASGSGSTILNTTIQSRLDSGTNVVISTDGGGADAGDIAVNSNIVTGAMAGNASLTLKAARNITLASNVTIDATQNSNTRKLGVILQANTADAATGSVTLASGASIKTNGGDITIGGGSQTTTNVAGNDIPTGNARSASGAGISMTGATLDAGGGDVSLKGQSGDTVSGVGVLLASGTAVSGGNINLIGVGGNPTGGSTSAGAATNTITATTGNVVIQGRLFAPVSENFTVTATQGNLTVYSPQTWKSGTLTLSAGGNLAIDQTLDASLGGSLTVRFGQSTASGSGFSYTVNPAASILIPLPTVLSGATTTSKFRWKQGTTGSDNDLVFNNGYLSFGAGISGKATTALSAYASGQAALNSSGQLNQPNFFDQSPDNTGRKLWYKLTYQEYSLDFQIGVGATSTTYWNGNTSFITATSNVPAITPYLDIAQYLPGVGSGPGAGVKASGVIKSVVGISIGGSTARYINRYSLGSGDAYLRTDSSISAATGGLTNVGLWVGTKDDFVGPSGDSSFKTVGNIGGPGFVANTATGQYANALRVDENVTNGASVLFYSIDSTARASFANFGTLDNAAKVKPAEQIAKTTSATDGSYALYTGLGDIANGLTKGFTWFYAAAPASVVNSVAQKVAASLPAYSFSSPQNITVNYTSLAYTLSDLWSTMSLDQGNGSYLTLMPNPANTDYYSFTYNGNPVTQLTNAGVYRLGISLSPSLSGTYLLSSAYAPTLTINPVPLTISGSTAANKVYDATTTATVTAGTLFGLIGTQTVVVSSATGTFASPNVGLGTVTPTYTLGNGTNGGLGSNYFVSNPPTLSASITPAELILTGTKVYDGTTQVTGANLTAKGVGTQTFTVTGSGNLIASPYPQTNSPLTSVSGLVLGTSSNGGLASNYNALRIDGSTFSVTKKPLTVSGTTVASKIYDGSTSASVSGGTLVGLIAGDIVSLNESGTFASATAGTNKSVTISDSLSGASASYYTLTQPTGVTGTITPKPLTVTGTTVASRVYDGTTTASLSGGTLVGVLGSDVVTLTQAGSFVSASAGTNKAVTAANTLGGASAANYSLVQPTGLTATITPKGLTVSGTTVVTRAYDGTTVASLTGGTLVGVVGSDNVTLSQSGVFSTANAGVGLTVTASGSLGGTAAGNYTLTPPTGLTGTITPKSLTVTGLVANSKTYDGQTSATVSNWGSVSTGVGTETLDLTHGLATFSNANAGNAKLVTASGYALLDGSNGGLASNYVLSSTSATATANITKAVLTVTANNDAKFITQSDTANFAGVSVSGFVNGETSAVLGGAATVTRSNSTENNAGTYTSVLVPNVSGLTAANYSFVTANGNYTIVPANQLLIRFNNQSTTYGSTTPYSIASAQYLSANTIVDLTNNVTRTGNAHFVVQDGAGGSAAFDIGPAGAATSASSNTVVGAYQLSPSGIVVTNANNFSNTMTVIGSHTVAAKSLTAQTVAPPSKVYDGYSDITSASLGLTGVENGDDVAVTGSGGFAAKNAGTNLSYTIGNFSLTRADAGNYYLPVNAVFSANDGTIQKAPLTVTANSASRTYGDANPALSTTLSGFVGGETLATSGVTGSGSATTVATSGTSAGTVPIVAGVGTLAANNYAFSNLVNGVLTINKAHLTVTADDASRSYGAANPALGLTFSGFKNGEILATSDVTGSGNVTTSATTATGVGTTPIVVGIGTLASNNYDFPTFVNGTLTINKAHLTVTANNASKTYGDANPTLGVTLSGFMNGETLGSSGVSGTGTATTLATAATGAGTAVITAGTGTLTASNYDFATLVDGTLTINKAPLTVTANNASKTYGDTNPAFSTRISGFVNGETLASSGVSGEGSATSTATTTTGAGTAVITAGVGTLAASNYDFSTLVDGTLTINKAHLTLTAANASKTYGDVNPVFSATVSGFVNGENLASSGVSGTASATSAATPSTPVGSADIIPGAGTLTANNYDFTNLVNGTLTINKAHLTITANNVSKVYGAPIPTLGTTLSGFVNGETLATSGVTGSGAATTTATASSPIGTAAIIAGMGTLAANNYDFPTLVDGTLTITKAPLTITASNASRAYGAANPVFSTVLSGFMNGETLATSGVTGNASVTTTATLTTAPGQVPIIPGLGTLAAANYDFLNFINGILTIQSTAPATTSGTLQVYARRDSQAEGGTTISGGAPRVSTSAVAGVRAAPQITTVAAAADGVVKDSLPIAITRQPALEVLPRIDKNFDSPKSGILAVTIVESTGKVSSAGVGTVAGIAPGTGIRSSGLSYEQKADMISLENSAVPVIPAATDKLEFSRKLSTFLVSTANGNVVAFEGGMINNHIVIVAPSNEAKAVAREDTKLVLAAAVTSLGREVRVDLAQLDGVIIDLR